MNRLSAIPKGYATLLEESSNRAAAPLAAKLRFLMKIGGIPSFSVVSRSRWNRRALHYALDNVDDLIVGSEAMAAGLVTRQILRTKYVSCITTSMP
jgi:hypothetical protein